MNNPKISIIMPVYNTGEILHTTIRCILNQTYKNFELLLIDDGSKDVSGKVCDDYAAMDSTSSPTGKSRIKVFHKPNGGICDARNYGLDRATGDYIAFCDHDDEYMPEMLERLMTFAEHNNCDIVKCGNYYLYDNNKTSSTIFTEKDICLEKEEFQQQLLDLINKDLWGVVWNGLYKRELIKANDVKFNTKYKHGGEDIDFNSRLFPKLNKIGILHDIYYKHYIRNSLSTSAKYYEDVPYLFLEEISLFNSMLVGRKDLDALEYAIFCGRRILSVYTYSKKLGSSLKQIKSVFEDSNVQSSIPNRVSCSNLLNVNNAKNLVYSIVCMLYMRQNYRLLYWISRIM